MLKNQAALKTRSTSAHVKLYKMLKKVDVLLKNIFQNLKIPKTGHHENG